MSRTPAGSDHGDRRRPDRPVGDLGAQVHAAECASIGVVVDSSRASRDWCIDDVGRRRRPGRDPLLDIALGPALLQRVAAAGGPELLRLYRPRPTLAFSGRDCASPGHRRRRRGRAGGRVRPGPPRPGRSGRRLPPPARCAWITSARTPDGIADHPAAVRRFGELLAGALRDLGVDAQLGPVPGEYCPGEFSINDGHGHKLVGTAQRLVRGGWLFGTVILVADPEPVREVLTEVYDALRSGLGPGDRGRRADARSPGVTVDDVRAAVLRRLRASWRTLRPAALPDDA